MNVTAEEALKRLREGNARHARDARLHPRCDAKRRGEIARGQQPFAAILGCADSRVVPAIVFDQGLGDLFVVRNGGNIADDMAIGSLEYAVTQLGVRLIVVLGHEGCGAVGATISGTWSERIQRIAAQIAPAVDAARGEIGDLSECAARIHAQRMRDALRAALAEVLPKDVASELTILAAIYRLQSGEVDWLEGDTKPNRAPVDDDDIVAGQSACS